MKMQDGRHFMKQIKIFMHIRNRMSGTTAGTVYPPSLAQRSPVAGGMSLLCPIGSEAGRRQ